MYWSARDAGQYFAADESLATAAGNGHRGIRRNEVEADKSARRARVMPGEIRQCDADNWRALLYRPAWSIRNIAGRLFLSLLGEHGHVF